MEDGHLVTDECGHWTVCRLLALVGKYIAMQVREWEELVFSVYCVHFCMCHHAAVLYCILLIIVE